jgi:hypothetical protein
MLALSPLRAVLRLRLTVEPLDSLLPAVKRGRA